MKGIILAYSDFGSNGNKYALTLMLQYVSLRLVCMAKKKKFPPKKYYCVFNSKPKPSKCTSKSSKVPADTF